MGKSTHFFGQPVYGQLIKSLERDKIVEMSRKNGGEKYVKSFDSLLGKQRLPLSFAKSLIASCTRCKWGISYLAAPL